MNQLGLFDEPKPTRNPNRPLKYGPPDVQDAWERGFSAPVMDELVARLNERVGQWLGWSDFADIRERHKIGCCMGHVLFNLAHNGRALVKNIYFGAERPGELQPYLGFESVYSTIEHGPAPEPLPKARYGKN